MDNIKMSFNKVELPAFKAVLKELNGQKKDTKRKVCKNCNELGHTIKSVECKVNIDINNKLIQKIKKYFVDQDVSKSKEECFNELSVILNITSNKCKTLYNEIPLHELYDRPMNIELYLQNIEQTTCSECNKTLMGVKTNTHCIWKGKIMCDTCWCKYENDRTLLWKKVNDRTSQCSLCCTHRFTKERFHYDHLNMFAKENSICTMIQEGMQIDDIYIEIDKCQLLCLSCHHIVTDIENKMGFTRMKQHLTRRLNQLEITPKNHELETLECEKMYKVKMEAVYQTLRDFFKI